jgi:glycine dehydrogenase subunit 1
MAKSYLPHTGADREQMLAAIGVKDIQELFADIPLDLRLKDQLHLPAAMTEIELAKHLADLAERNADLGEYVSFLGAGAYDHFIPSVVDHVASRSEFYTAYTQYQAEIAQGYLQALWEYQSMICEITGMEVANASMYDGGTALAEAALMAAGATGRGELLISNAVHPHYRTILHTYSRDRGLTVKEVAYDDGVTDPEQIAGKISAATAAVIIQAPNFFGCLEDIEHISAIAHQHGANMIVAADPIALGVLEAPGRLGADIVVGEGQGLGLPVAYGGPCLGFFATTEKLMRKMPGRIVGQTTDFAGNRGFVLTLQAREQHIRREKANSNICSNEALCALRAAVYLSVVGKAGFRQVGELCLQKAHYAQQQLAGLKECQPVFGAPFFKEFVVRFRGKVGAINQALLKTKIIGGLDLGKYYPELADCMLVCVTEKRTKAEIDRLVKGVGAVL